jgi:hypothetical protein
MEDLIYKTVNEQIQTLINFKELGFREISFTDCHSILLRQDKERILRIEYTIFPFGGKSHFGHIRYSIIFPIINDILANLLFKNNYSSDIYVLDDEPTIYENQEEFIKGEKDRKEISSYLIIDEKQVIEDNLLKVCKLSKRFIENYTLPFLDRNISLQEINNEIIEKYDFFEWGKFINGLGGTAIFKAIIIMKVCQNEKKYKEFTEIYSNRIYEAIKNGETQYQSYYDFLIDLIRYLDSGEYVNDLS